MLREKVGISRVFIRAGYTDLRLGIDGLACLIQNYFDLNPFALLLIPVFLQHL